MVPKSCQACPGPPPLPNGLLIGLSALSLAPFSKQTFCDNAANLIFQNLVLSIADIDPKTIHAWVSPGWGPSQPFVPTFPDKHVLQPHWIPRSPCRRWQLWASVHVSPLLGRPCPPPQNFRPSLMTSLNITFSLRPFLMPTRQWATSYTMVAVHDPPLRILIIIIIFVYVLPL